MRRSAGALATPRATKDVDFVVDVGEQTYGALVRALSARGFVRATQVREPDDIVPDFEAFRDRAGRRIDLLFAKTAFEQSALERAETHAVYRDVTLPVVTPEDLIVYKLVAARTQDWADVEIVARTQRLAGRTLDWAYVRHWCHEWEIDARFAELTSRLG